MKKAPVIEVELAGGTGRISEMCSEEPRFQLMAQPRIDGAAEQGAKVHAFFTVKNLNGVPRDCYLRVQLLDGNGAVVLDTRVDELTEIEGFAEAEIPVVLSLPATLAPARYEVRLVASVDEAETQLCPINNIHDRDAAYMEVTKAQEKPLMAKVEVFLADDSHEKVESGSIDMTQMSVFKIGVSLRTSEGRSYEGPVTMFYEDTETLEKAQVRGIEDDVSVSSSFDVPLYSYWLRESSLPWADGHTYRITVMGRTDDGEVELKSRDDTAFFLTREGDVLTLYQGVITGMDAAGAADTSFRVGREGDRLTVSGSGLRCLRLYSAGGRLLRQASSADGTHAVMSLQGIGQGVFLLQADAGTHRSTYRFVLY